ncbi:hypothetical protein GCM10011385_02470 [Nitratireductor aestuarii]|uniref:Uncharacterized protein n=1 Tax=Nitratireductor aestuarii TaxID=1735103 RepID=A0A916RCG7_9HYPH|nr:hypothetical protein [Nitratireductor aestuarii]GGA52644.1 hypothetical protein GCM10011385_02470 [Nitratireductor aestuarii]
MHYSVGQLSPGGRSYGSYFAPSIPYLNILKQWRPDNFTDPQTLSTLDLKAPVSQPYRFIVHTATMADLVWRNGVFSSDVDCEIAGRDAMCASLISHLKPFTFREVGVILQVPHQNILCAFHRDINSNLQAGLPGTKVAGPAEARAKYQAYLNKVPPSKRTGMLKENVLKHASFLQTPEDVLNNTFQRHNEIIVVTRPGVNVHPGMPATSSIKVTGYFMIDNDASSGSDQVQSPRQPRTREEKDYFFRAYVVPLAIHHGVPALRIAGAASRIFD